MGEGYEKLKTILIEVLKDMLDAWLAFLFRRYF